MSLHLYRSMQRVAQVDAAGHRGIAYGDGLFETTRVHDGAIPWWDRHWARLAAGAGRLRIPLPPARFVADEAAKLAMGHDAAALKLIVSRGAGGRGYAPAPETDCDWQLSLHPVPLPAQMGLVLRWCDLRLATQPLLAGLKHCNRLEQVMARAEWGAAHVVERDAGEGLLCDSEGHVVCATAANLFVLRGGLWTTPAVDRCGVAGVCRGWALEALEARQTRILPADVETADAIFLCNAVRGILTVARLGRRTWTPHPQIARVQHLLGAAHPAFAIAP